MKKEYVKVYIYQDDDYGTNTIIFAESDKNREYCQYHSAVILMEKEKANTFFKVQKDFSKFQDYINKKYEEHFQKLKKHAKEHSMFPTNSKYNIYIDLDILNIIHAPKSELEIVKDLGMTINSYNYISIENIIEMEVLNIPEKLPNYIKVLKSLI